MKILTNFEFWDCQGFDLKAFPSDLEGPHKNLEEKTFTLQDIYNGLPADWRPDLILCRRPMYRPMPIDIEKAPCLTVLLLDDWFAGMDYLPDTCLRFDYVFTDRTTVDILRRIGIENVDYWPMFGFDPAQFRILADEPRNLDITFAGNLSGIQRERLKWLSRLSTLPSSYQVGIYYDIFGENYVKLLNRSKIVFNRSIKREMNMRAFEAPACGALLFMEEENREIRDFLEPDKEVVLYNEENLEDLLQHYLANEAAREEIAGAGHRKIQNFTFGALFAKLVRTIEEKRIEPGLNRRRPLFTGHQLQCNLVQNLRARAGSCKGVVQAAQEALKSLPGSVEVVNDGAVSLATYSMNCALPVRAKLLEECLKILYGVVKAEPCFLVAQFNLAYILFYAGMDLQARGFFEKLADPSNDGLAKYGGALFPCSFTSSTILAWSDAAERGMPDYDRIAAGRKRVLRFFALRNLGKIESKNGSCAKAISCFRQAEEIMADTPEITADLLAADPSLAQDEGFSHRLRKACYVLDPFNSCFWDAYLVYLEHTGNKSEKERFLLERVRILNRIQDTTSAARRISQLLNGQKTVRDVREHYASLLNTGSDSPSAQ